jgi:hypothetical protein
MVKIERKAPIINRIFILRVATVTVDIIVIREDIV